VDVHGGSLLAGREFRRGALIRHHYTKKILKNKSSGAALQARVLPDGRLAILVQPVPVSQGDDLLVFNIK